MRDRPPTPEHERLVPSSVVSGQVADLRAEVTAREAARTPARDPLHWFARLVLEVVNKADRDRLLGLAAETAFFAVLTLFPTLLVAAAVLGQLGSLIGAENAIRVEDAVLRFLDQLLTDSAGGAIETVRQLFDTGANALTFATLLALISLSTAFSTLINTVNLAYDAPETRGWWRRRWLGLLLGFGSVLTGALAVTLLVIGPLFGPAEEVIARFGLGAEYEFLWSSLRWPVAFLALVTWATTMDHLMPARRTRWRYDLPGGLLTALLWLAASWGLNLYLDLVVTASPLFGALGGGLILMTWFYLLCVALLAGAELNAILQARRRHRVARRAQAAPAGVSIDGGHHGDSSSDEGDAADDGGDRSPRPATPLQAGAGSTVLPTADAPAATSSQELAGSKLAGSKLAGSGLAGSELAGSGLAGSKLAGSKLAGSKLAGSELAGSKLAGSGVAASEVAASAVTGSGWRRRAVSRRAAG